MATPHASDSAEQRNAEIEILRLAERELGVPLSPSRVHLPGGTYVDVDGVCRDPQVFAEVFARQGPLKGGQVHKVRGDVLKLLALGRAYPSASLVLIFASAAAARTAATGWFGEAVETFGIRVVTVELDEVTRTRLLAAQARQIMVNPPAQV